MYGYYRVAAAVPKVRVADVDYNVEQMTACYEEAVAKSCAVVVFPELGVTGYSCGDLFFQKTLLDHAARGARRMALVTEGKGTIALFGIPVLHGETLYNVAVVAQNGVMCAVVPKTILPNVREFYEQRQFQPGRSLNVPFVLIEGQDVPVGRNAVFHVEKTPLRFGIELCEDLWSVIPPSSRLALEGARAIFNLSASTELTGKAAYRRDLVCQQSGRCLAAYVFAGAGVHESTTDVVFGGHSLIADNGRLVAENERFSRESSLIVADIDFERLGAARLSESSFNDCRDGIELEPFSIMLDSVPESPDMKYAVNPARPFVPGEKDADERCREIIDIQVAGLAKRVEHTQAKKLVIGISGGLDSTLALLIASRCCTLLHKPVSDIVAVTMPGFGTTGRTYNNAVAMCRLLGVDLREIDIKQACLVHFEDIGHDPKVLTTTYENVQARERTQILMDLANKMGGLVIGTGDLSEIALGWSTYNGDHMSMYAVNCSIPKTLIRRLICSLASESGGELEAVLLDINATPVSPELLPASEDGTIEQKTEDVLGPYDLHDYFLYHFIKYAASPSKILYLAEHAFRGEYDRDFIAKCLKMFLRRFFSQQFKRSCIPDGPKVGSIALSPRGDWRMPSDAVVKVWMDELDSLFNGRDC